MDGGTSARTTAVLVMYLSPGRILEYLIIRINDAFWIVNIAKLQYFSDGFAVIPALLCGAPCFISTTTEFDFDDADISQKIKLCFVSRCNAQNREQTPLISEVKCHVAPTKVSFRHVVNRFCDTIINAIAASRENLPEAKVSSRKLGRKDQ